MSGFLQNLNCIILIKLKTGFAFIKNFISLYGKFERSIVYVHVPGGGPVSLYPGMV